MEMEDKELETLEMGNAEISRKQEDFAEEEGDEKEWQD